LAEKSGVSSATIRRLEAMDGIVSANVTTLRALEAALEATGVIFIDENGQGPGVRLRKERAE